MEAEAGIGPAHRSFVADPALFWRRRWESNPCIAVLQTAALPLRHCAILESEGQALSLLLGYPAGILILLS